MKKQFTLLGIIVVVAILTTVGMRPTIAKTLGWGYFDALVIGTNPASPTASLTSAGALTVTSITNTGAVGGSSLTLTGKFVPAQKTLAQLRALTPAAKGEVYGVSDGTMLICVSSGTGVGAFTSPVSSTTACN